MMTGDSWRSGGGGRSRVGQEALARLAEMWGRGAKVGGGGEGDLASRGRGVERSLGTELERAVEGLLRSLL